MVRATVSTSVEGVLASTPFASAAACTREPCISTAPSSVAASASSARLELILFIVILLACQVGEELVDQLLQHQRRLCVLDLTALGQESCRTARIEPDVLSPEQPRSFNRCVAVLGDLLV